MTFFPMRKVRQLCKVWLTAAILLLVCLPAAAQVTFSGRITVNTVNTTVDLANPAYYDATITSYDVSTPGALTCTGYPTIGVWIHRRNTETEISEAILTAGLLHWSGSLLGTAIQAGDRVYGKLEEFS